MSRSDVPDFVQGPPGFYSVFIEMAAILHVWRMHGVFPVWRVAAV